MTIDQLSKPKYYTVKRIPDGVFDKRGGRMVCEICGDEDAVWTGTRRPAARIMAKKFDFCDDCWTEHRME